MRSRSPESLSRYTSTKYLPLFIKNELLSKKKSLVVCYQGILEKNGAWLNLFIYWPILVNFDQFWPILAGHNPFCLENRQICCKSAQKKHEMIGWNPLESYERHFFSAIIAKNPTQIVLCHKRIISFTNSKF